jgi:hypothetical protein
MTAATDQFVTIAQRSQEAATAAVRAWADTLQNAARVLPTPSFDLAAFSPAAFTRPFTAESPLPPAADVHAAVDVWFDLVERLVAEQRGLATTLVDAGVALGEQAKTATTEALSATTSATNGHAL